MLLVHWTSESKYGADGIVWHVFCAFLQIQGVPEKNRFAEKISENWE
jgi:hypothetical protein